MISHCLSQICTIIYVHFTYFDIIRHFHFPPTFIIICLSCLASWTGQHRYLSSSLPDTDRVSLLAIKLVVNVALARPRDEDALWHVLLHHHQHYPAIVLEHEFMKAVCTFAKWFDLSLYILAHFLGTLTALLVWFLRLFLSNMSIVHCSSSPELHW